MEEKAGSDANKLLSEMMGEQGQDALRMLERLERFAAESAGGSLA